MNARRLLIMFTIGYALTLMIAGVLYPPDSAEDVVAIVVAAIVLGIVWLFVTDWDRRRT